MLNKIIIFIFVFIFSSNLFAKNTGLIFVSNEKTHDLTVIDPVSLEVINTIPTSKRPRDMHFNEDRTYFTLLAGIMT